MTLCILHLGSEKTGTSSIQKALGTQRERLISEGFWYPRSFANPGANVHLKLSRAAQEGTLTERDSEVLEFQREYELAVKAGVNTTILSSEFFHSEMRDANSVSRLREFLSHYFDRFQLVYYARRQDQMLASMHSTAVKGAWTTNPDAMSVYDSKGHYYFDHFAVCNLWSEQFGRDALVCRVYERERLVHEDVVDDFMAIVGCLQRDKRVGGAANESLSLETMWALLLVNGSQHKDNKELRRKLIAMGKRRKGKRVPMLTRSDAQAFHGRFLESNRKFFANYVDPTVATDFSGDFSGFPEKIPHLSAEDIQAFIFG
jgi:hypothetical protein